MGKKFPVLRMLILLIGDMVSIALATYLAAFAVRLYLAGVVTGPTVQNEMLPVTLLVCAVLLNINGLFSLTRKNYGEIVTGLAVSVANALAIMLSISFFLHAPSYTPGVMVLAAVGQFALLAVWNYLFWLVEQSLMKPRNALIIGSPEECARMVDRLSALPHLKDHVKHVCTDYDKINWDTIVKDIDLAIICADISLPVKAEIIRFCQTNGKRVFLVPSLYELYCSSIDLDRVDDIPVFRLRHLRPTLEQRILKRLVDLAVSSVALVLLSPVLLAIAAAVKLDSAGPVIYSQIRSGLDNREFKLYKFRTMRHDAEQLTGPVLAAENDWRVTRVGRVLRATRLDELPQLINVFVGEMSIVGPRPERPFFVEKYKSEMPEYIYRQNVKPGITGLAQVRGKYNTTAQDKLIYDLIYIQEYDLVSDFIIMLQTLKVLVTKGSTTGVKVRTESAAPGQPGFSECLRPAPDSQRR